MNTRKWMAECHAWLDDPGSVEYQVRTEWHVPQGLNNPIAYPDQNWRIKPRTIMLNGTELPKPVPCANDLMHRMTIDGGTLSFFYWPTREDRDKVYAKLVEILA